MPKRFVAEMLIDRISASRNYQKENYTCRSAWEYYARAKDVYVMNDENSFPAGIPVKDDSSKRRSIHVFVYEKKAASPPLS